MEGGEWGGELGDVWPCVLPLAAQQRPVRGAVGAATRASACRSEDMALGALSLSRARAKPHALLPATPSPPSPSERRMPAPAHPATHLDGALEGPARRQHGTDHARRVLIELLADQTHNGLVPAGRVCGA